MTAKKPLLGLTLWRPWPLLIGAGIKKIENRPWHPRPRLQPGEWFAIHSGKKFDDSCISTAIRLGVPIDFFDKKDVESTISCVARYDGHVDKSDDRWFFGPIGWLIGDVQAFEPIPCKGAQGLWGGPRGDGRPGPRGV